MAMDAKDLRIESALGAHSDDGNSKYSQGGTAIQTNGNKPYNDISSNSLAKVDVPTARPCAIIGPDRVVPPQSTNDAYVKKVPVEPWPCTESMYQHPPEYPYKPMEYQHSRNISPRQTFQENMQRIMVPPSYASMKNSEDHCLKNPKLTPLESKYCDVPYSISPINNEPKLIKSSEGVVPNNNPHQPVLPHGWSSSSVNVRPLRPYGAPDLYQYSEYLNAPGPRPISMIRPHRNIHEDMSQVYQDRYHDPNIRFKPYPTTKERPLQNPHSRYDYIPNYSNAFHPHASYPPHKYDVQKSLPTHPYSVYPSVPLKYLDRRMPVPAMEKYSRSHNQQVNFPQPFCNQNIPPTFATVPNNCLQNRAYAYAPDSSAKNMIQNRLFFESNNARKYYTGTENMFINDINRTPTIKSDVLYPSYPPINVHSLPPHHMYRKESPIKGYEHAIHYRNMDYSPSINPLGRLPLPFSPQNMSISPSDSNTSNDTTQILGNAQEDCGYASQSSTASIRSIESGVNRISGDIYGRHDLPLPHINKFGQKLENRASPKQKKGLNVRQFLQMWNEGDDEVNDNNKETARQRDSNTSLGQYESSNSQEQLYVLGLVHVPKEELGKYDHIQKISKLPENIKGYSNIELLNQYEKLVESPTLNQFPLPPLQSKQKDLHAPIRHSTTRHGMEMPNTSTRPISPLDVEAKISQSVIHKEVGCNFEIRPCSPQMMNVELATPVHNLLGERLIERVVNPVKIKSPIQRRLEESNNELSSSGNSPKVQSCKMASNQYLSPNNDSIKTNYCLQDLESSSGICLASLPRLDNDIELNFPEINQQFINANKIPSIRDLPILDTENSENTTKSNAHNQSFVLDQPNSNSDSDKDISKLSKYRKPKTNSMPKDNDDTLNISLHRTDSVIIKNPDNAKSQEECTNNIPLVHTPSICNLMNPVNIATGSDQAYPVKEDLGTVHKDVNDYTTIDCETAIDFSLNKGDDEQSAINSITNLNDVLQTNTEIKNKIDKDSEVFNNSAVELCSMELPKQLEEITETDTFSILPAKAVANFTCSNVVSNNVELQPIGEDNKTIQSQETVITSPKPKNIEADISLFNEEIGSDSKIPTSNHDSEIVLSEYTCNSNVSENITVVSNGVINKAINYCMVKQSDVIAPICELNDLEAENKIVHNFTNDVNIEDNPPSHDKDNKTSNVEVMVQGNLHFDCAVGTKVECATDSIIEKPKDEKKQTELNESKITEDSTNTILKSETEQLQPNTESLDSKIDDNVNFTDKCNDENPLSQYLNNINKENCGKPCHTVDSIPISITDNVSMNNPTTKMEFFENEQSPFKTDINNVTLDVEKNTLISFPLLKGNFCKTIIERKMEDKVYEYVFNKELFSPRVRNLLIYNEGLCASRINYIKECPEKLCISFDKNNHHFHSEENHLKHSVEATLKQESVTIESENEIFNIKDVEITSELIANNSTDFVDNGTITTENEHVDVVQKNDVLIKYVKDEIETENFAVENDFSETILDKAPHDTIQEKKIELITKFKDQSNEKNHEQSIWSQLSSRRNRSLKRSLSESAVGDYTMSNTEQNYNNSFMHNKKRAKIADSEILIERQVLTENFSNFIQSNRRNSISTIYNDENVSFCIFIDNECVLSEENEDCQKICYTEIPDECLTTICTEGGPLNSELTEDISYESTTAIYSEECVSPELTADIYYEEDNTSICVKLDNFNSELESENTSYDEPEQCVIENDVVLGNVERTIEEAWVEDVACMETVFSDDIAEDIIISAPTSPKGSELSEDDNSYTNFAYNVSENEHTKKVKRIYGNRMCEDDAQLVETLYRTPQMDVNKTLIDKESQLIQEYNRYYDNESLEKLLSESNTLDTYSLAPNDSVPYKSLALQINVTDNNSDKFKEPLKELFPEEEFRNEKNLTFDLENLDQNKLTDDRKTEQYDDCPVHSCESSCDNLVSYKKEEKLRYTLSSSPEVSSTTSEEKGPAILLKIRSYKGSKISEVNEMCVNYNHTQSQRFKSNSLPTSRPLITKAAQKYIPPLKETMHDLKVKIRLPKQSLYKLQQLKKSKEEPKIDTSHSKLYIKSLPQEIPKKVKSKPKFEDVLMSIDEIQYKKHKTKNKKTKQSVPKVIIKKNENGAHYASTQPKETYNPDLTGRKWQPWVFLEKSKFVDKMALKQKFKAIYNHRKKMFVLAENFRKYKSIANAKFVISHPKSNDTSSGKLKYTFRLKHD